MNNRLTILCVEDDPDQRTIIARCLRLDPDMDVHCACSPVEALDMVGGLHPDLVLLDLWLPGINGVELADRLHRKGYGGSIIFLTASARPSDIASLTGDAILGVITKPFQPLSLAHTVRSMMPQRKSPS